jgi:hypothetical protein
MDRCNNPCLPSSHLHYRVLISFDVMLNTIEIREAIGICARPFFETARHMIDARRLISFEFPTIGL